MELRKTRVENLITDQLLKTKNKKNFQEFWNSVTTGVVNFSYIKKDGTTRYAMGTVNPEIIKEDLGEDFDYFKSIFALEELEDGEISLFGNQNFPNTFHYIDLGGGEPAIRQFRIDTLKFPDEVKKNK